MQTKLPDLDVAPLRKQDIVNCAKLPSGLVSVFAKIISYAMHIMHINIYWDILQHRVTKLKFGIIPSGGQNLAPFLRVIIIPGKEM